MVEAATERAKQPLRLVFCGTPQFAVPSLAALIAAGHDVTLVLTQPDRPQGRGLQLTSSPVKEEAQRQSIAVRQPATLRNNTELRVDLEALRPDAIVVVAYGRIIPQWMLTLPRLGNINLHGSLLPKYRGAAPVQWAVANGEHETGVTTMLLNEGLDTGPMLERQPLPIAPEAMAADMFNQLAQIGAPLVLSTLAGLAAGTLAPAPQPDMEATYAPILTREDGRLDATRTAQRCYDRWRGFSPWPGAWAMLHQRKLGMTKIALAPSGTSVGTALPGTLTVWAQRLFLHCGEATLLELLEVQREGRRAMPAAEFLRGSAQIAGARLG